METEMENNIIEILMSKLMEDNPDKFEDYHYTGNQVKVYVKDTSCIKSLEGKTSPIETIIKKTIPRPIPINFYLNECKINNQEQLVELGKINRYFHIKETYAHNTYEISVIEGMVSENSRKALAYEILSGKLDSVNKILVGSDVITESLKLNYDYDLSGVYEYLNIPSLEEMEKCWDDKVKASNSSLNEFLNP